MSFDRAKDMAEAAALRAADLVRAEYEMCAERCESPIERLFAAAFFDPDLGNDWDLLRREVLVPPSGSIEHVVAPPLDGIFLWPQIKVGPYRVDFIVGANTPRFGTRYVVVECDGHDFHERTKEQAARDKARDRYLMARGYKVLRFTGSEIHRDPRSVWDEVVGVVFGVDEPNA